MKIERQLCLKCWLNLDYFIFGLFGRGWYDRGGEWYHFVSMCDYFVFFLCISVWVEVKKERKKKKIFPIDKLGNFLEVFLLKFPASTFFWWLLNLISSLASLLIHLCEVHFGRHFCGSTKKTFHNLQKLLNEKWVREKKLFK